MLAYYLYPFGPNQEAKEYTKQDLSNPCKVEELFNYCQILEGYITRAGWQFLIDHYGYEKLFEIDKKSGWLCERTDDSLEEYKNWIQYEIESYPSEEQSYKGHYKNYK